MAKLLLQKWAGEHNDQCSGCGLGGDLLCCDTCNLSYHLLCLPVPLEEYPPEDEDWYCPQCQEEINSGRAAVVPPGGQLVGGRGSELAFDLGETVRLRVGVRAGDWTLAPTATLTLPRTLT